MSNDSVHRRATSELSPKERTFKLKKRKKQSKKKKKKTLPFPINPVIDDNVKPSSPSKSARKSSKPTHKTKKKSINKASSLIRTSPRFTTTKTKISKSPKSPSKNVSKCKPKKSPRKRKKRTNSSSVYKFVDYDAYINDNTGHSHTHNQTMINHNIDILTESDSDCKTPIAPIENNTILSLSKFDDHSANDNDSDNDNEPNDTNYLNAIKIKTRRKTPRKRSHSVSRNWSKSPSRSPSVTPRNFKTPRTPSRSTGGDEYLFEDENIYDNALLKRLKTENKELRKSRNILRKDNDLLSKVESKLRHKLDMILIKFKQIKIDIVNDGTDWNKLQKKGDIEGVLDAVFMKFNDITDQFVKQAIMNKKWNKLKNEWNKWGNKYGNGKRQSLEYCFDIINKRFNEIEREKQKVMDLVNVYEKKDKKYVENVDELEEKLLIMKEKSDIWKKEKMELEIYKQKCMQFEDEKMIYSERLEQKEGVINEKEGELNKLECMKMEIENENKQLTKDIGEYKINIENMENGYKDKCKGYEERLSDCDIEMKKLTNENKGLVKRKEELDGLKQEHLQVTQTLNEVQAEIDGLQDEFRIIYKRKKKMESENDNLNKQILELKGRIKELEINNDELNIIVNKEKDEMGTQTEFNYILEDAHIKSLQKENEYLMNELNFLIAERSRFKNCNNDKDYHKGDISSIVVSPCGYQVITGGKQDNSLRIWEPKHSMFNNGISPSEISFAPKKKALIDGLILTVSMSNDGVLLGVGASLKNTVNGYVVIYNMKDAGNVLCNLRSRTLLRFGKVHCVKFMKYDIDTNNNYNTNNNNRPHSGRNRSSSHNIKTKSNNYKTKGHRTRGSVSGKQGMSLKRTSSYGYTNGGGNGFNYLVFCGDTTGMILCWNLSCSNPNLPVCVINGHSDIVYDLTIINNKWLFSVSHDQCLMYVSIDGFEYKICDNNNVDYVFSKKLFIDDSKYALQAIAYNNKTNDLIFGSRKCNMFKINSDSDEKNENDSKYFVNKYGLNSKDLDHICKLKKRNNLMIVQRIGINYVKVFNINTNKLIKTYQIDDGNNDNNKFKIYDCGISYDSKYAILCVGVFNKENLSNLELNRSALKGFKIPKSPKK